MLNLLIDQLNFSNCFLMLNFRETKETLLHAYSDNLIDEKNVSSFFV